MILPSSPIEPVLQEIGAASTTPAPRSFTNRDVEAAHAMGEDMTRVANEALATANKSLDVAVRTSKTRLTRVYVERLKRLSLEYPFLTLPSLDAFEQSIRQVEIETHSIAVKGDPGSDRDVDQSKISSAAINLRILKFAEIVGSKVVISKKLKTPEYELILTSLEPCGFDGPLWSVLVRIGDGPSARDIQIDLCPLLSHEEYELSSIDPVFIEIGDRGSIIIFRERLFLTERQMLVKEDRDQARLRAKKIVYDEEGELTSIRAAVSNLEAAIEFQRIGPRREPIPDDVKMLVWSRDGGSCVRCGSTERLHFDHVIPVAKGGSNEGANIQLLCQPCNLKKSDKIAF